MPEPIEPTSERVLVRRPWSWQRLALAIGLVLAAFGSLAFLIRSYVARRLPLLAVAPRQIQVSPELTTSEVVPADPGSLAGCNVVLITLDTTRADRIGCYGNDEIDTPNLDYLARQGVLFSRAMAPAPCTLPSHCSMMTGLFPYRHGARANNLYRLDEENHTLAEILSDAGYRTAAFISAFVLDSRFGLGQGFEEYDGEFGSEDKEHPLGMPQRSGDETTELALTWLREVADERFFLWIHLYDPHHPRTPPEPYRQRHRLMYDGEIAFADAQVGALLGALTELGLTDTTLVIAAGDHGEGLGQHEELTHSFLLYDSTLHVPMIMACGQRLGGGVHVSRPVSLVDVLPTVLSLLGLEGPNDTDGVDLTQPSPGTRPFYAEAIQPLADYGWAALLGVVDGALKYIHGPKPELYDLSVDPFEDNDLIASQPQVAAGLRRLLEQFYGQGLDDAGWTEPTVQLNAEDIAKLQALGYLGTGVGAPPPPESRPNPKEMMKLLSRVHMAMGLEERRGPEATIAALQKLVEEHPDFAVGRQHLGAEYAKNGDYEEAEAEYRRCIELQPDRPQTVLALARLKERLGQSGDAVELYRVALRLAPEHFMILTELSQLLLTRGEFAEAAELLKRAVRLRPSDSQVPDMLATAMTYINRRDEAIALFNELIEQHDGLVMARNALARLQSETKDFAGALATLRDGAELATKTQEFELANNLAVLLVSCPDTSLRRPHEAASLMERICEETRYEDPRYLHTLSMIYSAQLRMDEAIAVAEKAREIVLTSNNAEYMQLAPMIGMSLEGYKQIKATGISRTMTRPPAAATSETEQGDNATVTAAPPTETSPQPPATSDIEQGGNDQPDAKPPQSVPVRAALPTREGPIGGEGMNVVLVSVDTTRADHLGCYGHDKVKTPNIDRFAAEGTRFANCISSAPLTLPSHATMLTGSYPFVHGARDNGIFVLQEENVTLAEIFKQAGYTTRAEVAALVLNRKYGLSQGFDTYGDVEPPAFQLTKAHREALERALAGDTRPDIQPEQSQRELERKAEQITSRAIELLTAAAEDGERVFMFLHYFDPHQPHEAPERFASQYTDGYYAEIAYFDEQFGRLVDAIRDLGLAGKTLVMLTSDHGEGRGQHGEATHSFYLYDTTLHVPLILWCPGQVPAGQVVESQVRLVDLAPTALEFARLELSEQIQGESLLPLLADPTLAIRWPCYSDSMVPKTTFDYSPLRSLRVGGWKYILSPHPELYHVEQDRLELFNRAASEAQRAAAMRQELYELIEQSSTRGGVPGGFRAIAPDEVEQLRALGYISAGLNEDSDLFAGDELELFEPKGINPRDRVEVVECWAAGLGSLRAGAWERAETLYRRFMELEPENPIGPSYVARALIMLERNDEAIEMFRRAIELKPDSTLEYRQLGNLLAMKGDSPGAAEAYQHAIENDSEDYISRFNLGKLLISRGRPRDALVQLERAIEIAPTEELLHVHRGVALRMAGRMDEAVEVLEEAIGRTPEEVLAHDQLAVTLNQFGRSGEAIERLVMAIDKLPEAALLHHRLAELYTEQGLPERAGLHFAKVVEVFPENAIARQNHGTNLFLRGKHTEAVEELRKALELEPEFTRALFDLARALESSGELDESAKTYSLLLEKAPNDALAYSAAANLRAERGDYAGAIEVLRNGLLLMPDDPGIANDVAWHLATCPKDELRNGEEAVQLAEYAVDISGAEACGELDTLAAAYAEVGRFEDAVETAKRALRVATKVDLPELASRISGRLELYQAGRPYRDR